MKLVDVGVRASFRTRLTHRVGTVQDVIDRADGTKEVLVFFDDGQLKHLHPSVEVDAVDS